MFVWVGYAGTWVYAARSPHRPLTGHCEVNHIMRFRFSGAFRCCHSAIASPDLVYIDLWLTGDYPTVTKRCEWAIKRQLAEIAAGRGGKIESAGIFTLSIDRSIDQLVRLYTAAYSVLVGKIPAQHSHPGMSWLNGVASCWHSLFCRPMAMEQNTLPHRHRNETKQTSLPARGKHIE